jgi:hypothetical protein
MATNLLSAIECKNATSNGPASANSTMGMAFTSGFIAMAGSIGGCDIGRLEAKNLSPLASIPKSR